MQIPNSRIRTIAALAIFAVAVLLLVFLQVYDAKKFAWYKECEFAIKMLVSISILAGFVFLVSLPAFGDGNKDDRSPVTF